MYEWYEANDRRNEIFATYGRDYVMKVLKVKSMNKFYASNGMPEKPIPEDIKPLPL